jgi:hypothetical protein
VNLHKVPISEFTVIVRNKNWAWNSPHMVRIVLHTSWGTQNVKVQHILCSHFLLVHYVSLCSDKGQGVESWMSICIAASMKLQWLTSKPFLCFKHPLLNKHWESDICSCDGSDREWPHVWAAEVKTFIHESPYICRPVVCLNNQAFTLYWRDWLPEKDSHI